jgi:hypothetical protein
MERFFSQRNIERHRQLLAVSTDKPERRLIFKVLAAQARTLQMDANSSLTVRVERRGDKYTWELHRDGHFHPVKFSAPVVPVRRSGQNRRKRGTDGSFGPLGTFGSSAAESEIAGHFARTS